MGAAAVLQARAAQQELERINSREREIFIKLLQMGVKEDDPDLNRVHKALLQWYRLDQRQREIKVLLDGGGL